MNSKAQSMFETIQAELNGELLQSQALLSEAKETINHQLDAIDRLTDRNNALEGRNNTLQDTVMSLTSQMDHWKRQCEASEIACNMYRCQAQESRRQLNDINAILERFAPQTKLNLEDKDGNR